LLQGYLFINYLKERSQAYEKINFFINPSALLGVGFFRMYLPQKTGPCRARKNSCPPTSTASPSPCPCAGAKGGKGLIKQIISPPLRRSQG
jgi:hypothetical protein